MTASPQTRFPRGLGGHVFPGPASRSEADTEDAEAGGGGGEGV